MNSTRIPINHPLTQAARAVNAHADQHGLEETIEWLDMHIEISHLVYLGEQRAIRAVAASLHQVSMNGRSPILDEALALSIVHSPLWKEMRELLISCYMDGMAIGWKARELSQE